MVFKLRYLLVDVTLLSIFYIFSSISFQGQGVMAVASDTSSGSLSKDSSEQDVIKVAEDILQSTLGKVKALQDVGIHAADVQALVVSLEKAIAAGNVDSTLASIKSQYSTIANMVTYGVFSPTQAALSMAIDSSNSKNPTTHIAQISNALSSGDIILTVNYK